MNKLIEKISWQLCAFCAAGATLFMSCTPDDLPSSPCIDGDCNAEMVLPGYLDDNGYYHIDLDFDGDYLPWFQVDVYADKVLPQYEYNGVQPVEARFDSDTHWTIGDSLMVTVNNYNPFQGPYDYIGNLLPNSSYDIILNQFAGTKVNIVQGTTIYFSDDHERLRSKRVVGPIPPMAQNDTITLYMEVYWEGVGNSVVKDHYFEKFIVE